jgi:O-antigen ligase
MKEQVNRAGKFLWDHAGAIALYALLVLWCSIAFSMALAEVATVVALVFWLLWRTSRGMKLPAIDTAIVLPLAAYVLLCVLSLLWTEAPKESYRGIFKVLKYGAIFWMAAEIFAEQAARKKFEAVFAVFFAFLVLDGLIQYCWGRDLLRGIRLQEASSGMRVSASFKSFGLLAAYLITTSPCLFGVGLRISRAGKMRLGAVLTALSLLGGGALLLLTRSRGAMIAFVAGLLIFLGFRKKVKWLLFFSILLGLLCFLLPRNMIIHRDITGKEQSIIERYYLWDRAMSVIKAKPWTGTGINTYVAAHAKYDTTRNWRVRDYYAHNGYLQAAAETGIPSVVCLLVFLLVYFVRSLRVPAGPPGETDHAVRLGLLLGIFNFLLMASVDTVFHNPQAVMVFWYLLGVQYGYLDADRRKCGKLSYAEG